MRMILIGLGNPILGDDAVGWKVVEQVEQRLRQPQYETEKLCDIVYLSIGGLGLMECLIDYDRAIIVDALSTGHRPPGTITTQKLEDIIERAAGHTYSAHDASLNDAVNLARRIGARVPEELIVVGIETDSVHDFSEVLTSDVEAAIPQAVENVIELLTRNES